MWGVYCERIGKSIKYECDYCDRNCDPDLVEPDCKEFGDYYYSQLEYLFEVDINYFQRVYFSIFLISHIVNYYFTLFFRTCDTPYGVYLVSSCYVDEVSIDDIPF